MLARTGGGARWITMGKFLPPARVDRAYFKERYIMHGTIAVRRVLVVAAIFTLGIFSTWQASAASTGSCGVERWSVKTGTDPDAGLVDLNNPVRQTIAYLTSLPAPTTIPSNARVQPTETTAFIVDATLTGYKLESDSDYHLILQDSQGRTMIAEIPDPACVGSSSPFKADITNARSEFDAKFNATTSFQSTSIPVEVEGVGFFDYDHGQTGVAPNAIELHPVLNIIFNPSSGGGGGSSQLVQNPGFESGTATPWSLSSSVLCSNSSCSSETAHSGSWFAWMDGYGSSHTDTLSQQIAIPSGMTSATLTFWMHIDTAETTTSTKYDTLKLQLLDSSGNVLANLYTYSNLNANSGYSQHTFNLSPYIGKTVTLRFTGTEDGSYQTSFVIDDVNVQVQ